MGMRDGERKSVEMKPEEGRGGLVGSVTSISFLFRFFRPGLGGKFPLVWRLSGGSGNEFGEERIEMKVSEWHVFGASERSEKGKRCEEGERIEEVRHVRTT